MNFAQARAAWNTLANEVDAAALHAHRVARDPQPINTEMPAPPRQTGMGETTFYHARFGGMMVADARRMRYVVGM